MWLINVQTRLLEDFTVRAIPRYAILSHTWTGEEVTFQEFLSQDRDTMRKIQSKKGLIKIMKTCQLAARHDIGYVWVDTCCIDKRSSAELSEAINSMWRYYKDAEVCYAYLSDLQLGANVAKELSACRWITRGWTLQELIAPKKLEFYDERWNFRVTKDEFAEPIQQLSIAERMTWASKRETMRIEDTAYCLLGIFDINMPLLYGEGNKAFIRLQQEIIRNSNDLSIFGWCSQDSEKLFIVPDLKGDWSAGACKGDCGREVSDEHDFSSVLARTPNTFAKPSRWHVIQSVEHSVTNRGIKIDCSLMLVYLRGCLTVNCKCCSHCRKYVLAIRRDKYGSYGIILNKRGPDALIRSQKQLIRLRFPKQYEETKHRPIYLLTKAPDASQDPSWGVSLDINMFAGELQVYHALPESNWDWPKRHWHGQDHDDWGIVGLWFVDRRKCNFYVLFSTEWYSVFILDSDLCAKEIALLSSSTSAFTGSDVPPIFNIVYVSKRISEKDFRINERAVRVKAKMMLREGERFLAVWTEDIPAA